MTYRQSINNLLDRQEAKGINKYGKPLDQNGRDMLTAIEYLQEELVDGLYYCEELKDKLMAGYRPQEVEE